MGFLSNLFGGGGPHDGIISNDLKRLESLKVGLGEQAIAYVRTGADGTVLSSLATLCKANELGVSHAYVDPRVASGINQRRRLFATGEPYDVAVIHRYAEVLCAAAPGIPAAKAISRYAEGVCGTDKTPRMVRIFFTEAFLGMREDHSSWPPKPAPQLNGRGLTPDRAIEMTRLLGGDVTDLFDVLFVADNAYSLGGGTYRKSVDLKPIVEAHASAFIAAIKRMPAASRADAINTLGKWGLATTSDFIEAMVEQAGEGAKAAREAAAQALRDGPPAILTSLAVEILKRGDANQRAGMVDLLAQLGTADALEALRAHRPNENTARIAAAIDTALAVESRRSGGDGSTSADDATGYTAIGGERIAIPPLAELADGDCSGLFGEADRSHMLAIIAGINEQTKRANEDAQKRGHSYRSPPMRTDWVADAVEMFRSGGRTKISEALFQYAHTLSYGPMAAWTRSALQKMPPASALRVSARLNQHGGASAAVDGQMYGPGSERLQAFLNSPEGDARRLELIDIEIGRQWAYGDWRERKSRTYQQGDLLRHVIQEMAYHYHPPLTNVPRQAMWPYLASNLDVLDEALALKAHGDVRLNKTAAVRALTLLPAPPERYFAPLLEIATGETKHGRAEARSMLNSAPEVEARLIALLDDSRQAIRAGAADWLSLRRDKGAIAALQKRLKKEKSEVARAAILSGLKRLGVDLSDILGPEALIVEAEKGLKSAKFDKLHWLALDKLSQLKFRNGDKVPNDVLRWWIFSAFKLKQPGGNALFEIYLDQLEPKDAEAFSVWMLESWVAYDTAKPSDADANAHAKANAKARYQMYQRWQPDFTEEKAFAQLKAEFMSVYPNSGAESKGVLALATRAPSALAAERVRAFLKAHGPRTSQASALLEMLGAKGDAVSLQVVIAAATRLKQKGVQKFAGELVQRIAESRDWTMDELADRTVPTAGLDEDGVMHLVCGEDEKMYEVRIDAELEVVLRNPAGKEVANLPSGQDEATKAAKKQLSTTKKELKQIISMQSARLYEGLCSERSWATEDWRRSFHDHPVMRRLVERVVWLGLNDEGEVLGAFRPTAEGDFTNTDDEPVDIDAFQRIRIAHGALLDDAQSKAWADHLKDYEVKPLFAQFGRTLMRTEKDQAKATLIDDRKGWLTDAFTIRGAAAKLGYERGGSMDGGFFNEYRKPFTSAGLAAVIEFTGNSLPEQNIPAALVMLRFERATGPGQYSGAMMLGDVPPVLLSECWNDYHAMSAKAKFDPEWEKKAQW